MFTPAAFIVTYTGSYRFLYGDQGMLGIVISTEKVHGYTGLGSGQRVQGSRSRYR